MSGLQIASTLRESSKGVSLDVNKASSTLTKVLSSAGMATAVAFTPALTAFVPKAYHFQALSTSAGVVGASVAASALVFSSLTPDFKEVTFASDLTNKNVAVMLDVDHNSTLQEIYCVAPDASRVAATNAGSSKYQVEVAENGTYELVAVGTNGKTSTYQFTIDCIDKDGPHLGDYSATDDSLTVHFSDEAAGVNFDAIYAETDSGVRITPVKIDASASSVTFDLPDENFTIIVEDQLGNTSKNLVTIS